MANLADFIEKYLKEMISISGSGTVEMQRADLADKFNCVPSQINYVLSTRFTPENGYLVETRRGGGGYIRILKITIDPNRNLLQVLNESIGNGISCTSAQGIIQRFVDEDLLSPREGRIIKAILEPNILRLPEPERNVMRALILKAALLAALS